MVIWTFIGASTCFMAHHLFPGFRRQTLALKGFLTSGAAIFGLVTGAEEVLQSHEAQQRTDESLIRRKAMHDLGKRGIIASEAEIEKWREEARDNLLERLRKHREAYGGSGDSSPSNAALPSATAASLQYSVGDDLSAATAAAPAAEPPSGGVARQPMPANILPLEAS